MAMKTFPWKEFLQAHPTFSTLRDEARIAALLAEDASSERIFNKDDVIVRQGEVGASVFLIGAGTAEATLTLVECQPISLSVMRKGDLFGEMAVLDDDKRSATVVARESCTILEIHGPEFQQLLVEYPQIESRLLVMISRRLRKTGEQILGRQQTNVDGKLMLFNLKLDTEQKLLEATTRAAQAMFDQTKLRTDEVINSAERSRDRLNKSIQVGSAFATVVVLILGAFGFKQIWDVHQMFTDAAADVEKSSKAVAQIEENREKVAKATNDVAELMVAVKVIKTPFVDIVSQHFVEHVNQGAMVDAMRDYDYLKGTSLGGLGKLEMAVDTLEPVLLSDYPPKPIANVGTLLDDLAADCAKLTADTAQATDSLPAVKFYRLRIGYSILTDDLSKAARKDLDHALDGYLKRHPEVRPPTSASFSTLLEKLQGRDARKAAELKSLRDRTTPP